MNTRGLNLLIPEKPDVERDAVASEWEKLGGTVIRLGRFWEPPALPLESVRVYGNETFCFVLQEKLGLSLETPADDLLLAVPSEFLRRTVTKRPLKDASGFGFPIFAKTLVPKLIPSRVYASLAELLEASSGLSPETELLLSEVVTFVAEVRAFLLCGEILDVAVYEHDASLEEARAFIARLVDAVALPTAVVVDVGLLANGTWALVEFNAAWGAGLNGCDAKQVLPAIAEASRKS